MQKGRSPPIQTFGKEVSDIVSYQWSPGTSDFGGTSLENNYLMAPYIFVDANILVL